MRPAQSFLRILTKALQKRCEHLLQIQLHQELRRWKQKFSVEMVLILPQTSSRRVSALFPAVVSAFSLQLSLTSENFCRSSALIIWKLWAMARRALISGKMFTCENRRQKGETMSTAKNSCMSCLTQLHHHQHHAHLVLWCWKIMSWEKKKKMVKRWVNMLTFRPCNDTKR